MDIDSVWMKNGGQALGKKKNKISKLFVYGIFLDAGNRQDYYMSNPSYAVVPDYVTGRVFGSITEAIHVDPALNLGLTGLLVEMPSFVNLGNSTRDNWADLDELESAYDRIVVRTVGGDTAWMYVTKGDKE